MKLRDIDQTTLMTATTESGITDVLITNNPDQHPGLTFGRVVLMPNRALISLVTPLSRDNDYPEIPVIDHLSNVLLGEVRDSCLSPSCTAEIGNYNQVAEDIGVAVLASGVICEQSSSECSRLCPKGINQEL